MVSLTTDSLITPEMVKEFHALGYVIIKGLFSPGEVNTIRTFFDDLGSKAQSIPGHWVLPEGATTNDDPLKRYPRVMHPHRFNDMSKQMMLHPRVRVVLRSLLEEEAVACQSMFYFKPPGARGQALHQDNFYLDVMPGTCIAAWTAIDAASPENGGLYVVPNTNTLPIQCPEVADPSVSFTTHLVNAPKGFKAVPVIMEPGDTLFFNGNVIHGSGPNRTTDQWRRSFICHYLPMSSKSLSKVYRPVLDFDGNVVEYEATGSGGPCGTAFKPSSYDKANF